MLSTQTLWQIQAMIKTITLNIADKDKPLLAELNQVKYFMKYSNFSIVILFLDY